MKEKFCSFFSVWRKCKTLLLLNPGLVLILSLTFNLPAAGNGDVISDPIDSTQQLTVRGNVTDATTGEAMPGVNIVVMGTTVGTMSDASGNFTLQVPNASVTLEFSFIGYARQDVPLGGRTTLSVALLSEAAQLSEVVVIGYGTQKKITVTGAIQSVRTEDLITSPNASVANTLAGKVTGLSTVQYSGQPGEDDPNTYIRGIGSLSTATSTPLILVDGVERSFTQMDPNEIESLTVLKDASATAVFGVRGANGVILVTTKRGVSGKPKISFSTSHGIQQPTRVAKFVDSYTYATIYNQCQLNDDPKAVVKFSDAAIEAFRTNSDPIIYPNTDFIDYILKPSAYQTQNNLNISGGSESVKYFVSLGYLRQDGLFHTFDLDDNYNYSYNRYNYRTNLDMNITKTTKVALTVGGRSGIRNEPISSEPQFTIWRNIFFCQPYRGIGIVDGRHIMSDIIYVAGETRDALNGYYGQGFYNRTDNVLNFDIEAVQQLDAIIKGLSFRIKGSYNSTYTFQKTRSNSTPTYFADYLRDMPGYGYLPKTDKTIVYRKSGSRGILGYSETFVKNRDWYMETALSYDRTFGPHHVTGLLLYNESKVFYPSVLPDIPRGYVGLVGRITYDYNSKYLLDLNMGYNGSENFAPGKRFGLFPAVSAGWVLTEENFMQNIPFISYMKLRASYGMVGNDIMGSNRFLYLPDSYDANSSTWAYSFGIDNPVYALAAIEGTIGNPDVTWEKARKQNYGIDINFFNDKLGIVFDYFSDHRYDILSRRNTVPAIVSLNLPVQNLGIVDNHGFEAEITWRDKIGEFNYTIHPTVSFARNEIIFYDEVPRQWDYQYRTGHPVNQPFRYIFDGYWTEADVAKYKADPTSFPNASYTPSPGDLRYKDLNDDGVINSDDQMAYGFPDYPEWVFGLTTDMNYKGFDLHVLFTGAANVSRVFSNLFQRPFGPTHGFGLMKFMVDGTWTPEKGDASYFPRWTFNGIENNVKGSSYWTMDASYIRLKNMELGYNFNPSGLLKRLGVASLRIYTNGYDIFTIDRLKNYYIDPESIAQDNAEYPIVQIYNFGINVTF